MNGFKIFTAYIAFLISVPCGVAASKDITGAAEKLIFSWRMEEAGKLLSPDSPEYIKGLFSFYTGNYREAKDHFSRSGARGRYWSVLTESILPAAAGFSEKKTDHFIFRYSGKDRILVEYLEDMEASIVDGIDRYLGWRPSGHIIVEIYPDRESFQAASTLNDKHMKVSGAVGICKFNRIMICSPRVLRYGYNWPDTFTHEYTHYAVAKITGLQGMPLWFNEGLARYLEETWRGDIHRMTPVEENFILKSRKSGSWVGFEKMRHGMPALDTRDEVTLAFAQVFSITGFIAGTRGWESIRKYLREIRDGDPAAAFIEVFGESVDAMQAEWKNYISRQQLSFTPGAAAPKLIFAEEPFETVSEWISETAATDIMIAEKFEQAGNLKLAAVKYRSALEKDPGNPLILNRLGKILMAERRLAEAGARFSQSVKSNPSYVPPYLYLADIMEDDGEPERAVEYLMEYIYRSPFNPEAHERLAVLYRSAGHNKKAKMEKRFAAMLSDG